MSYAIKVSNLKKSYGANLVIKGIDLEILSEQANQGRTIIEKFEELEKGIDPSWTDLEKALYVYVQLAKNVKYEHNDYVKDRNLCAILETGVCAGYASIYKEAMDRLGVECDIINEP